MSANVETMMYVREKPWHGLGTRVEQAQTSAEALTGAGLDWSVYPTPVFDDTSTRIDGYTANKRSSDGAVLGVVGRQYQIVQNEDAFAFTDALIGEGCVYETAGSLHGGRRIWLLARMPERRVLGDAVEPYLCFVNTHDGSGAVRACMTPVRVVCNNTLNIALAGAKRAWATPHKGDVMGRLDEAMEALGLANEYMTRLDEEADRLVNAKLDDGQIISVVNALIPIAEKITDRQRKTAEDRRAGLIACTLSPDLIQYANTKWGLLNAVADYVGHAAPARLTSTFAERRWEKIMTGHPMLDQAVRLLA